MYTKKESVLVKRSEVPCGYIVMNKETRTYAIIEDINEAQKIIDLLLADGVEVFDNWEKYDAKYPPLTFDERKEMSMRYLIELGITKNNK